MRGRLLRIFHHDRKYALDKDVPLPTVKELSAEYAEVLERKKKNYSEYKKLKRESKDWQVADAIVQMIVSDETYARQEQSINNEEHNR